MLPGIKTFETYPRVFVSYAHSDGQEFATSLRKRLEQEQPEITFWQDRAQMQGGIGWWKQITEALDKVEILIMIMTPAAMVSEVAGKEWRYARQQGVRVCPVMAVPASDLDFQILPGWMKKAHFYDLTQEWDTFVNFLKSPGKENRVPFMAPDLLENYVDRQQEFNALLSNLLDETRESPLSVTTALQGSGGFGKTTLACSLCHHEKIISAFDDGILWVSLGEQPDVQGALTKLYAALTGERPPFVDTDDASIQLSARLEQKSCLLVIDDIWDSNHLKPFLRGGQNVARLITTRQLSVLNDIGCSRTVVDKMTEDQSVKILTSRINSLPSDFDQLRTLANRLGEWPLLLKLAASQLWERIERGDSLEGAVAYLNRAMDKRGVVAFDRANSSSRHDAIASTVASSLDLFSPDERVRCAELAIFPNDTFIPLSTVSTLWELDEFDTEELIQRLDDAALLDFDLKTGGIRMHNVLQSYLKSLIDNTADVHTRLVSHWWSTPYLLPDRYAWKWIVWHLFQARDYRNLNQLLLDFNWLKARLEIVEIQTILQDFELLKRSEATRMVRDALQLASHVLSRDPQQLSIQLIGRLDRGQSPIVDKLLDQADASQEIPRLVLADTSLTHPGGSLTGIIKGHVGSVEALALSPDGRWAVSGSNDWSLRLWDLESNRLIRTFEGHSATVHAVTFTPDGKSILSGSEDRTLRLWDLASGRATLALRGHTLAVQSIAIGPDGKLAASVSEDGTVRVWDLTNGQSNSVFKGLYHQLNAVSITPDCQRLIFGVGDWTIMLLDLNDGREKKLLEGHSGVVRALAITADGRTLVSGAEDQTLRIWQIDTGECLGVLKGHTGSVDTVALTTDGRQVVSGSRDRTLRVWDLSTGETLRVLEGHSGFVRSVAIAATTGRTISGSTDRSIRYWDIETAPLRQSRPAHIEAVSLLAISADGGVVISGAQSSDLFLWRTDSNTVTERPDKRNRCPAVPNRIGLLKGHTNWVRVLRITADGKKAVTGSSDRTLRVWNLEENSPAQLLKGHIREVLDLAISADGTRALSLSRDRTLRVWDLLSGQWIRVLVSRDNERALSALRVKNALLEELMEELDITPTVDIIDRPIDHHSQIAISRNGSQVVFCSYGIVCLWDLNKGTTKYQAIGEFECTALTFDSHAQRVILGSLFGSFLVWTLDENTKLIRTTTSGRGVLDIVISADGRSAITAGKDDTIQIWEIDTGQLCTQLAGAFGRVDAVAVSPNGEFAYSVYQDTLVAYDLTRSAHLASLSFDHQITALSVTPDGRRLAVGDQSGCVHFLCLQD